MTRKELRDVLDDAVGNTPRVDLAEAAWTQGVGMRRRRRAAFAGGGTVLAAAAVVGALVISGGIAPDEDVAPAVPTSTPEPSQVEPGPVDISQARTYLFNRSGTTTDLDTSSLQSLRDQGVPSVDELSGSSWDLAPVMYTPGAEEFIDIVFAGPEDPGATEPTTLSFVEAEDGDTLLSISIDECGGATYQEDLALGADGRFAGQSAGTDDQGCPDGVQAAEDLWMGVLPAGGWLHQPHEDVLLLSVIAPEDAAPDPDPDPAPTADVAGDLADARTLAFRRPGTDTWFDPAAVPPLTEQQVPSVEDLSGASWELIPVDQPRYAEGPNEVSGIHVLEAEDLGAEDLGGEGVQGPPVPTEMQFEDVAGGLLLSIQLDDCGGASYPEPLTIAEGRFAGQEPLKGEVGCAPGVQAAEEVWVELLAQGGWLHQPSGDLLLLSIAPPEGLLPEPPPPPEAPDPTLGVQALDIGAGLPNGWTKIPLWVDLDAETTTTCLLPDGESALFAFGQCTVGVEVATGMDAEAADTGRGWWDPADPPADRAPEECYVARPDYGAPENAVTFTPDPETGSTTIDGHPVEWSRWAASCADGQEFTAEAWRVTDLGIQLRSMDGSQDVEPLVHALLEEGRTTTMGWVDVEVTEPIGDIVTGELQAWEGVHRDTGEQVTFTVTDDTRCLVTKPGGVLGADLQLGSCEELMVDLEQYPVARVIVTPDGDVLTVHVPAMF